MQRNEHLKQRTMYQFPPDMPAEEQVRILTEEYRNLFDAVEKLTAVVEQHDAVING